MDILNKDKYIEFSHILSGCRTIIDAYYFAELYIKNNTEMSTLIYSMVNGKRYDTVLDFNSIISTVEIINNYKYINENDDCTENQINKTNDTAQKRVFSRILKNKPTKHEKICIDIQNVPETEIKKPTMTKNCPHCSNSYIAEISAQYVICGYMDSHTGFDWKGCGKDWCFSCGKMLCKSWDTNQLFLELNRGHDNDCCKQHAQQSSKDYINEYCQCNNPNVNRKL